MTPDENPYFDAHHGAGGSSTEATSAASLTNSATATEVPVVTTTPSSPVAEHPPTVLYRPSAARAVQIRPLGNRQQSSIRLRRGSTTGPAARPTLETIPSEGPLGAEAPEQAGDNNNNENLAVPPATRQRSNSGSRSLRLAQSLSFNRLPTIGDENQPPIDAIDHAKVPPRPQLGGPSSARTRKGSKFMNQEEYASNLVDFLDVIGNYPSAASMFGWLSRS